MKNNIEGKITNNNINYTEKDIKSLEPLCPEEIGKVPLGIKQNRIRMENLEDFPDRLPTSGLMPYPIDEDDFIGQFESKKNIYLTLAHAFNKAMERIEELEKQVVDLTKK